MEKLVTLALLLLAGTQGAQIKFPNPPNPVLDISSCQELPCNPPNGSICALGEQPGPEIGVGIAANAVNTSGTNLSLTLIDGLGANGFTGYIYEGLEYSDQSLFVGADPELSDEYYPEGCALMMQYRGQTFPKQWSIKDDPRDEKLMNTTSCTGVLDVSCQSAIIEIIQSFDDSSANSNSSNSSSPSNMSSGDRCSRLTEHVNSQFRNNENTCGQSSWIANFMNATGGTLPRPNTNIASSERLGNDQCRPVLPESDSLYKVAEMRSYYFVDPPKEGSDFYAPVFGGRAGYTPVMAVLYGGRGQGSSGPEVQFTCMKTFQRDGEARQDSFESAADNFRAGFGGATSVLATILCLISFSFIV